MRIVVGLPQIGALPRDVLAAAREAEAAGAWGVSLFDHLAPWRPDRPVLDGWSLLGPVGRVTTRVRVVSLVTRAALRHPAVLVRQAAVARAASGGRFVLGLGAGDARSRVEEAVFGLPPLSREDRLARLRSVVTAVRADALLRPEGRPPEIWVAGVSAAVLEAAAQLADGWHAWGITPDVFAGLARRVREDAGRPVACWWGGRYDPDTAARTLDALAEAGADGASFDVLSTREATDRARLLRLVAQSGTS